MDARDLFAEFDKALAELRELCDGDVAHDDAWKRRLAVRKEMNRLLGLYTIWQREVDAADDGESETLTEIRQHLEPLGLAPEGTPLPELARLAALKITEK